MTAARGVDDEVWLIGCLWRVGTHGVRHLFEKCVSRRYERFSSFTGDAARPIRRELVWVAPLATGDAGHDESLPCTNEMLGLRCAIVSSSGKLCETF